MGHAASTVLFLSRIHFVNAVTGHINGLGLDMDVGGVTQIIRGCDELSICVPVGQ